MGIFICSSLLLYFYPDYAKQYSEITRLNTNTNGKSFPKNFRILNHKVTASAQFSEAELQRIVNNHPKMWIIDLREESHAFLNGDPISWYRFKNSLNKGKSKKEIRQDEIAKLKSLSKKPFAVLYKKKDRRPFFYRVQEVSSSEEMAHKYGANYKWFPTTDAHHPKDEIVDQFVTFIRELDPDAKLHFHCSAGRGRTTTFLAMYEMIKNANNEPLKKIIARQKSLGGVNLLKTADKNKWKYEHVLQRRKFVKNFHQYCKENPDFILSWSEWNKKNFE